MLMIRRYFTRVNLLKKRGWFRNVCHEYVHPHGMYIVKRLSLFKIRTEEFGVLYNA